MLDLCDKAEQGMRRHSGIDRTFRPRVNRRILPIPAAMAVGCGARLVEANLRCDANIIIETGAARDPHLAVLIGFCATAVSHLAYETLGKMIDDGALQKSYREVMQNYQYGINKGLYKIMSKMGISTIASYRCSQLFGSRQVCTVIMVELCFKGVTTRIQGRTSTILGNRSVPLSRKAWTKRKPLEHGGLLPNTSTVANTTPGNPDVVGTLQTAVKSGETVGLPRLCQTNAN